MKFQSKFLNSRAKNTAGVGALAEAKQASTGNLQNLEEAKKAISVRLTQLKIIAQQNAANENSQSLVKGKKK